MNHQTKEPTKLDVERIIHKRTLRSTQEDYYRLKNLELGALGEQIVFNYLKKYEMDDWIIIRNMWLNVDGPFEADLILLTNHGPYLFEVKNYTSDFIFENGVSSFNGHLNSGNPINQTRRNTINLQKIGNGFSNQITVQGVLVLVGVDNYVEINDDISNIKIIKRNELKRTMKQIVKKEKDYRGKPVNNNYLLKQLKKHEIDRYHGPEPLSKEKINTLQKGICCLRCNSFDVTIKRKTIECICGFTEERELAILRTICEYGVLTFDRDFKIGELLEFFDYQINHVNLRKVLKKYFKSRGKGKHTFYINKSLPLYKLYKALNIDSQVNMTMDHETFYNFRQIIQERNYL